MAAVSSISNPLAPSEILLFYLSDDLQVTLQQQKDDDPPGADIPASTGDIRNPSQFACLRYRNLINVYGITQDNNICRLSPARLALPHATTTKNSLAVIGDGNNLAWAYFLDSNFAIQEYSFSVYTSAVIATATPYQQTYLAAFYDTVGSRNIVYQTSDYYFHVFNVVQAADTLIQPIDDAMLKSPIAVATMNPNGITYIYYLNSRNRIWRCIRNQSGVWGTPTQLNIPAVDPASQISVTTDSRRAFNHVFYLTNEQFADYPDALVPPEELLGDDHEPTAHLGDEDKPHYDLHLGHPGEALLQWTEGHGSGGKDKKEKKEKHEEPKPKPKPKDQY